jgi:hypothetical protein
VFRLPVSDASFFDPIQSSKSRMPPVFSRRQKPAVGLPLATVKVRRQKPAVGDFSVLAGSKNQRPYFPLPPHTALTSAVWRHRMKAKSVAGAVATCHRRL